MTEELQNAAKTAVSYHVTHETDDKPIMLQLKQQNNPTGIFSCYQRPHVKSVI